MSMWGMVAPLTFINGLPLPIYRDQIQTIEYYIVDTGLPPSTEIVAGAT